MNHLMIGDGIPGNSFVTVVIVERIAGMDETKAYTSTIGTATVIRRSADKRIFGSFEFTAGDPGSTITVTGTFNATSSP